MKPKILLAGFDLDGTVLEHDSSWAAIHRHFGTDKNAKVSLKMYEEGKIDYREFMRRDIASWPKNVTKAKVQEILSGYKIRPDAPATIARLQASGIETALVTSGIDILARMVAQDLGIRHWIANGLKFDEKGKILPDGVGRVDPTTKDVAYKKMLAKMGLRAENTIAVGDTVYDLRFLKCAALGFLLAHTTRVPDPQIIHIEKLSEIFDHI